ncbi:TPA: hypothetical protein ACGW5B_004699 [Bacillus paranthracis]|uniref:hypothetical protein n=1 Tax=unclassified Bacillus cereus group TaxID=2750818 RepID=UPI0005CE7DEC|nr:MULTISPECIES: hypothetical protein [Bacillus cereus group]PGZ47064.1 hypothetical protein COE56_22720 [Bacillus anthracis]TBL20958.1 hypothetical protein EYB35_01005 [Bacillus paranthracis]AOY14360.1 hypothetical protein BGI23_04095 [Bacillus sp. ABP14]RAS91333.1 hypothetical protein A6E21_23730 [Bacillus cereus]RAT05236.1 hypothetical protein A6E27_14675 [Bacillus cereus]
MKAAVKHNISDFRDYLKSNDIYMEENIDENDGSVHFSVGLETEAGAKIQLIAAFQNEHPTVDIYCFNVAHVPDATATNDILHVINELNTSYRFAKFTLNKQNAIDISTSLAFSEPNFNPALVFEHTRMLYKLANDEYKNLMKVIWA